MKEGIDPIKAQIRQQFLEKVRKASLDSFRSFLFDAGGSIAERLAIGKDGCIRLDEDSRTATMLLCALKGEKSTTAGRSDVRYTVEDIHEAAEAISGACPDILFEFDEDAGHISYTATLMKRQTAEKKDSGEGNVLA